MTLQMILALFIAHPKNPVGSYMLSVIRNQFIIIICKFVLFCFLSCYGYKIKEKGTPSELRSYCWKLFLLSLSIFLGMYILYMVQFILYCTMDSDPDSAPIEWDVIFAVKLLFWEILGIYNLMLVYGLFNFGKLKENALTKFDDALPGKEGGES